MSVSIRPVVADDAEACGRVIHEAFRGIAATHAFPPDCLSTEAGTLLAAALIASPAAFGVVAERDDGRVVGCNFLAEGDPIRAVGPITVDPSFQGGGVGRRLMQLVLERAEGARGVRLVADAFNSRSVALYASLGFEVKELLLLMRGTPRSRSTPGLAIRPLVADDIGACARLCGAVHDVERSAELRDALERFTPSIVEREGRITGYLTAPTFWQANHGIAETEGDMRALIAGAAAAASPEPISFLLPARQASLFRWCVSEHMRVVKPMTLMAMGEYREPRGAWFPSVAY